MSKTQIDASIAFLLKILKKNGTSSIQKLVGNLGQATPSIREVIRPQKEKMVEFVLKYPNHFEFCAQKDEVKISRKPIAKDVAPQDDIVSFIQCMPIKDLMVMLFLRNNLSSSQYKPIEELVTVIGGAGDFITKAIGPTVDELKTFLNRHTQLYKISKKGNVCLRNDGLISHDMLDEIITISYIVSVLRGQKATTTTVADLRKRFKNNAGKMVNECFNHLKMPLETLLLKYNDVVFSYDFKSVTLRPTLSRNDNNTLSCKDKCNPQIKNALTTSKTTETAPIPMCDISVATSSEMTHSERLIEESDTHITKENAFNNDKKCEINIQVSGECTTIVEIMSLSKHHGVGLLHNGERVSFQIDAFTEGSIDDLHDEFSVGQLVTVVMSHKKNRKSNSPEWKALKMCPVYNTIAYPKQYKKLQTAATFSNQENREAVDDTVEITDIVGEKEFVAPTDLEFSSKGQGIQLTTITEQSIIKTAIAPSVTSEIHGLPSKTVHVERGYATSKQADKSALSVSEEFYSTKDLLNDIPAFIEKVPRNELYVMLFLQNHLSNTVYKPLEDLQGALDTTDPVLMMIIELTIIDLKSFIIRYQGLYHLSTKGKVKLLKGTRVANYPVEELIVLSYLVNNLRGKAQKVRTERLKQRLHCNAGKMVSRCFEHLRVTLEALLVKHNNIFSYQSDFETVTLHTGIFTPWPSQMEDKPQSVNAETDLTTITSSTAMRDSAELTETESLNHNSRVIMSGGKSSPHGYHNPVEQIHHKKEITEEIFNHIDSDDADKPMNKDCCKSVQCSPKQLKFETNEANRVINNDLSPLANKSVENTTSAKSDQTEILTEKSSLNLYHQYRQDANIKDSVTSERSNGKSYQVSASIQFIEYIDTLLKIHPFSTYGAWVEIIGLNDSHGMGKLGQGQLVDFWLNDYKDTSITKLTDVFCIGDLAYVEMMMKEDDSIHNYFETVQIHSLFKNCVLDGSDSTSSLAVGVGVMKNVQQSAQDHTLRVDSEKVNSGLVCSSLVWYCENLVQFVKSATHIAVMRIKIITPDSGVGTIEDGEELAFRKIDFIDKSVTDLTDKFADGQLAQVQLMRKFGKKSSDSKWKVVQFLPISTKMAKIEGAVVRSQALMNSGSQRFEKVPYNGTNVSSSMTDTIEATNAISSKAVTVDKFSQTYSTGHVIFMSRSVTKKSKKLFRPTI